MVFSGPPALGLLGASITRSVVLLQAALVQPSLLGSRLVEICIQGLDSPHPILEGCERRTHKGYTEKKRTAMGNQRPSPNVKTLCNCEPQIWPEIITSRDAKSFGF